MYIEYSFKIIWDVSYRSFSEAGPCDVSQHPAKDKPTKRKSTLKDGQACLVVLQSQTRFYFL